MEAPPVNEQQIEEVLIWVDSVPLTRTPKNLARDFADGVLVAELMKNHFPTLVHLHNYQPANSSASKYINWKTLNEKIFRKFNYQVHKNDIESAIAANSGAIQRILHQIYKKVVYNQNRQISQKQGNLLKSSKEIQHNQSQKQLKSAADNFQYSKQLSSQLAQKQSIIEELRQTIEILQTKFKKMEQLNRLKDAKIDSLMKKIDENIGI